MPLVDHRARFMRLGDETSRIDAPAAGTHIGA
jgi:hypothetical protein